MKPLKALLDLAKARVAWTDDKISQAVIDLLGEADPCGFEAPTINNGGVVIPDSWMTNQQPSSPEETRAMGRMLFEAADEAEG